MFISRGVINDKEDKAAALPKFSDMLTLSESEGADYAQPLALPHLKFFIITWSVKPRNDIWLFYDCSFIVQNALQSQQGLAFWVLYCQNGPAYLFW